MRGTETKQATMLSRLSPEQRVPPDHPLRGIKRLADEALAARSPTFDAMYSRIGRPRCPGAAAQGDRPDGPRHRPQ